MSKLLPILCYNRLSCNFEKPVFLQKPLFINIIIIKYTEVNPK